MKANKRNKPAGFGLMVSHKRLRLHLGETVGRQNAPLMVHQPLVLTILERRSPPIRT